MRASPYLNVPAPVLVPSALQVLDLRGAQWRDLRWGVPLGGAEGLLQLLSSGGGAGAVLGAVGCSRLR